MTRLNEALPNLLRTSYWQVFMQCILEACINLCRDTTSESHDGVFFFFFRLSQPKCKDQPPNFLEEWPSSTSYFALYPGLLAAHQQRLSNLWWLVVGIDDCLESLVYLFVRSFVFVPGAKAGVGRVAAGHLHSRYLVPPSNIYKALTVHPIGLTNSHSLQIWRLCCVRYLLLLCQRCFERRELRLIRTSVPRHLGFVCEIWAAFKWFLSISIVQNDSEGFYLVMSIVQLIFKKSKLIFFFFKKNRMSRKQHPSISMARHDFTNCMLFHVGARSAW